MNDLIKAYELSSIKDNTISPPPRDDMEMDSKLYADYKKSMTQNLGKWKSGKLQHFEFLFDPTNLLNSLRNGEKPNYKQEWHYFPTPEAVINQMGNIHIPWDNLRVLEPSAGRGAIMKGIDEIGGNCCDITWECIEAEPTNRKILQEEGYDLIWDDFDTFEIPDIKFGYDVIYANPPFKKDRQHVEKMLKCLAVGGSAVIVLPSSFETKYVKHIQEWEENFEYIRFHKVPDNAFKESGTGVNTVIMYAFSREK